MKGAKSRMGAKQAKRGPGGSSRLSRWEVRCRCCQKKYTYQSVSEGLTMHCPDCLRLVDAADAVNVTPK